MWLLTFICLGVLQLSFGQDTENNNPLLQNVTIKPDTNQNRDSKMFSMFQVIKFPNDMCTGSNSRNGTCYTSSECTAKGGTSAGSCASGYGVCCTFVIGCGQSAAQNCTYVESTGATGLCKSTICKSSTSICQLRLDFVTFQITGPNTLTASVGVVVNGQLGLTGGGTVALATQCTTDTFTVTPSNNVPVICGTLTGDHIYVDASNSCNDLTFNLGAAGVGATLATRTWQIKVTQYACDSANRAPSGCLQYFYGNTVGQVRSFNFGGSPAYHLANQKQTICVRRERGYCRICWSAAVITDFQLSGKTNALMGKYTGSKCCGYGAAGVDKTVGYDCVIIPGATNANANPGVKVANSYCGRSQGLVANDGIGSTPTTICSRLTPFQISFYSDNWEYSGDNGEGIKAAGFRLSFILSTC